MGGPQKPEISSYECFGNWEDLKSPKFLVMSASRIGRTSINKMKIARDIRNLGISDNAIIKLSKYGQGGILLIFVMILETLESIKFKCTRKISISWLDRGIPQNVDLFDLLSRP